MPQQFPLYIDGAWVEGTSTLANISPSDTSDVIGEYAQASKEQVHEGYSRSPSQPDRMG